MRTCRISLKDKLFRWMALSICVLFSLSTSTSAYGVKVSKLSSYNTAVQTVRVGLANMTSNALTVTLNGEYEANVADFNKAAGVGFELQAVEGKVFYESGQIDQLVLKPKNTDSTIRLEVGARKYNYKGSMTFSVKNGLLLPVNTLDIETYLKGVVGYEMSNTYPIEALKAQAIAARNYTLISMNKHNKDGYDLCDKTDCQVYRGENKNYLNVIRAVNETSNKVIVYGDELVGAYYSASSGGYTEASSNIWNEKLPYLIVKKDDYENEKWPFGDVKLNSGDMDTKIKEKKYLKSTDTFVRIDLTSIKRNESGRVQSLDIIYLDANGVQTKKTISKEGPRTFLSLPSSLYQVSYDLLSDTYLFSGMGNGHGVGMSQIGAKYRAKAGQTYKDILSFYYDGTTVTNLSAEIRNDLDLTTDSSISIPGSTTDTSIKVPPNTNPVPATKPGSTTTKAGADLVPPPSKTTDPATNTDNQPPAPSSTPPSTSNTNTNKTPPANIAPLAKIDSYSFTRELKKGMNGDDVKKLQELLKKLKLFQEKQTTTYFGAVTEKCVAAFQKQQSMKSNGIVDKATLRKLAKALEVKTQVPITTQATKPNTVPTSKTATTNKTTVTKDIKTKPKAGALEKQASIKNSKLAVKPQ